MVRLQKLDYSQLRKLFVKLLVLCIFGLLLFKYASFSYFGKVNHWEAKMNYLDIKQCFKKPTVTHNQSEPEMQVKMPKLLDDVIDKPPQANSIFFHETKCSTVSESERLNIINLTVRAACAIESAALHNPKTEINVLFARPTYWDNNIDNPAMQAVLSYPNVRFKNLDLWSYVKGIPSYVEKWFITDELFKSKYVVSHLSDFLRFVTLRRYGGTYLDTDVIVLRNLEELPPNYVGAESSHSLNSAVMNFAYDGIGRQFADHCLADLVQNFDGNDWGKNGPGVITRTAMNICQTANITDMFDKKRCLGFQIYKPETFYAIPWTTWSNFFDEETTDFTLHALKNSYIAHIWNQMTVKRKHHIGHRSAYGELAAIHCPKVFATVNEHF